MKWIITLWSFLIATAALAIHDDKIIANADQGYTLSDLVDIDQLFPSASQSKIIFDKNFPCIMFSSLEKKFLPPVARHCRYWRRISSNAFDFADDSSYRHINISNSCGETLSIDCGSEAFCRFKFSYDASKIYGSLGNDHHFIFAEKHNKEWVKIPRQNLPSNFVDKAGYYLQDEQLVFRDPQVEPVNHYDFYLGCVNDNKLLLTDEDDQRNYVYDCQQLISANQKYIAQKIKGDHNKTCIYVSEIIISNQKLALSFLYKACLVDNIEIIHFGLTNQGTLLLYHGQKSQAGGLNKFTNEHFLFLMLAQMLGKIPYDHSTLALSRMANNLVDYGPLKNIIRHEWKDRPFQLKLIILNLLEKFHRETRFIETPLSIFDLDHDFRKQMADESENKQAAKNLLQNISLAFYGKTYKQYKKNLVKIKLNNSDVEKLLELFPNDNDLDEIIKKYNLALYYEPNFSD